MELQNTSVIITRPQHQARSLFEQLKQQGASPLLLPVMSISTDHPAIHPEHIKQRILDLDHYHYVIVVSANAARFFHDWVDQYWPQMPEGIHWLAVGEATANTLLQLGYPVSFSKGGMNSESLLSLPELQQLTHQKVLICRGVGGRELLSETLQRRGASVDYLELYFRSPCQYNQQELRQTLLTSEDANQTLAIFISSGEGLQNLTEQLQQLTTAEIETLKQSTLIVPSERVATLAQSLGYHSVTVADNATDQAMINALMKTP